MLKLNRGLPTKPNLPLGGRISCMIRTEFATGASPASTRRLSFSGSDGGVATQAKAHASHVPALAAASAFASSSNPVSGYDPKRIRLTLVPFQKDVLDK